jgi:hypothetical protein
MLVHAVFTGMGYMKRRNGNPGGLVISGFAHKEGCPAVQSLPSCLGEPVAVIQDSHVDPLLPQLPPLHPARRVQRLGFSPHNVVVSTVAPSRPVHSPIRRASASATSSLAKRLPHVVAPRSRMSGAGVSSPRSGSFLCASGGGLCSPPNISAT